MGSMLQRTGVPLVTIIVAMVAVLFLDVVNPLGVVASILYFPLLMIAAICLSPRIAWSLAALCAVFIAIAALGCPSSLTGRHFWFAIASQLATIPLAATVVWLTLVANRSQAALKAAYEVLHRSEELSRSLIETVPAGVMLLAHDGSLVFANPEAERLLRTSAIELASMREPKNFPYDVIYENGNRCPPEEFPGIKCLRSGLPEVPVTLGLRGADGRVTWGIAAASPMPSTEAAATPGAVVTFADIMPLKNAEEALRRSEQEFRTLAENLPDVVSRYDRQFRQVFLDCAMNRTAGSPVGAPLDRTLSVAISDELAKQFPALRRAFVMAQPQEIEFSVDHFEGQHYFECRIVPEIAADGTVESVLCISRDITERVHARQQDELHLAELAHASRLSTIGGLVSEIAHEINQPLHAIVNFAQASINVLERTPTNHRPNLFGWLRQISEQANRAAEIIRRAGRFARNAPIRRSAVDVNALVRDCLNLLSFDLRMHHVAVRSELDDGLPQILADTVQIQQVLVNLLRNAVEAMSENAEDDRVLKVRTTVADDSLEISVCDNGSGFHAGDQEKVFEPFFTTKQEGLGLGLAVCQSIIQAHSGRLWAEQNSGRGVTFRFALPVHKEVEHDVPCHV